MSEPWDRYKLATRLEKLGDDLMTACENREPIDNRIDVCAQAGAVCRIVMTLKALRTEVRREDPDEAIAGSAVHKYAAEFAAMSRAAGTSTAGASKPFVDGPYDPADE